MLLKSLYASPVLNLFMSLLFSRLYCKFSETFVKYFAFQGFHAMFSLATQLQILSFFFF